MSEKIIIKIDEMGDTEIRTEGFSGSACQDATRDFEKLLGVKRSDKPTPEIREVSTRATVTNRQ